jgi:biotin carboxyl carrier protein
MPCRILRLLKSNGAQVKKDEGLLTMESMKMETRLYSRHDGTVQFRVKEGDIIQAGVLMVEVEPTDK